jgi:two-component system CheB/CheR fusion protein
MRILRRDRLRRQDRVLVELAKSRAAERGDQEAALRELAEAAAVTLEVARVSVWLYDADRSRICCMELFERALGRHSRGAELASADFPVYFRALEQERTLAAHDAPGDERTRELAGTYLVPLGIGAMLDAPVRAQGRIIGVVCNEHIGPARRWTADEQSFAASIADLAALVLEAGERHKAERELRERVAELQTLMGILQESEERYRLATEAVVGLVYDWDVRSGRVQRSGGLERLLGFGPREAEPSAAWWQSRIHPEDSGWVAERMRRLFEEGAPSFSLEYRARHRDGHDLWVWESGLMVRDAAGRVVRVVGSAIDVSERKRVESELRQAKEAAEEANEAKDRFLATLSHELRTPLTPVLAVASMLERDGRLPGDARGALTMLRRNVELEARLIDDLLDLTRIAHGKLELDRRSADVRQILEHALETVAAELMTKRLRLVTDLDAGEHSLWGDAPRLTQVFWNLLHNAIKFTPAGGTIAVRSRVVSGAPGELTVEISDSGIGIEPQVLPRIFNAFEQADPRITRQFGGLGLGLAVSRAIVELHGGTLTAASSGIGHGATFTIRLPVTEPESRVEAAIPGIAERSAAPGPSASPLHLLLVEDHADTAAAMADLLRGLGYQVTVAMTVAEALAASECAQSGAERLDLVVSDLGLPDGTGFDVMRELAGRHGLRGIALSGYGMEEDLRKSREAGFERHLTKPVNPQSLDAAIRQVMGGG